MNLLAAALVPLILTLPQVNAGTNPSHCTGTTQTHDLRLLRIYRQQGPGAFLLHVTKSVTGREGRPDTVWVDPGTGSAFYATVIDSAGNESCPSVALFLGPVTAAESEVTDRVLHIRYYDVHGRRMSSRHARGVYWEARHYHSGHIEAKKLLLLR